MRFVNVLLVIVVSCFMNLTTACDSGTTENENDVISNNDTIETTTIDEDGYGDTALDMLGEDESESDADAGDPLEDYYCIEGTWKLIEIDGEPDSEFSEVTIELWDAEKGAGAGPFPPLGGLWFKKNLETEEFSLFNELPSGDWAEGTMNSDCNHIEFDFHDIDSGTTHHNVFEKH